MAGNSNNRTANDEKAIYEVEKICDHRRSKINNNVVEYLIKWKDYDVEFNTWEKEGNIYSKGLIMVYWSTQPYTLEAFRSDTHTKKEGDNITKKRPANPTSSSRNSSPRKRSATASPSLSNTRLERQQLIKEIKAAQISAAPPVGYTWSDIEDITNVFYSEPNIFFAEVKWPKQPKPTYIPTRIIKKYNPLKLLLYYESRLEFRVPESTSK